MFDLDVSHPWVLLLLPLVLLPWLGSPLTVGGYPWTDMLPRDRLSRGVALALKLIGALVIAALILGIAGLHLTERTVQRIGRGAHIVLVIDRSLSMDQTFSGKTPSGDEMSKAHAAKRMLTQFVHHRQADLFGVVSFSTKPLFHLPLTDHWRAVEAAVATLDTPGLAFTNVAGGLLMGLSYFEGRPRTGSRAIVLVSDGATVISSREKAVLRRLFLQHGVGLYWLFLQTEGGRNPLDKPEDPKMDTAKLMPERYLHMFFQSLETSYHLYQAEDPKALKKAIAAVGRLEDEPLIYFEDLPRVSLANLCYAVALAGLLMLLAAKWAEVRTWR